MNCKNCGTGLSKTAKFCETCGAPVVTERITAKPVIGDFLTKVFGWENKFFVTTRTLLSQPGVLFKEYLAGTRKKYVNPFAYLAIGAAISALVFNVFLTDFLETTTSLSKTFKKAPQEEVVQTPAEENSHAADDIPSKGIGLAFNEKIQKATVKYYNIITFLGLPISALVAFWAFGKPYNYMEHLVITAYIQGFLALAGVASFILSIVIHPSLFYWLGLLNLMYFFYAYAKLYQHTFRQTLVKFLVYMGIAILFGLALTIIAGIGVVILVKLGYKLF